MDKELIIKSHKILEEVESLKKYNEMVGNNKQSGTVHFEIHQHYGDCEHYEKIKISRSHNAVFFDLVDKIITQLEAKIESL